MDLTSLNQLLDNKAVIGALSAVGGSLVTMLVALYRHRIRVSSTRSPMTALACRQMTPCSGVFASRGRAVTSGTSMPAPLWSSTTTVDFTNLKVKVSTGDTLLLNERSEIARTTYLPAWTDELPSVASELAGEQPTERRLTLFDTIESTFCRVQPRPAVGLDVPNDDPNPDAGPASARHHAPECTGRVSAAHSADLWRLRSGCPSPRASGACCDPCRPCRILTQPSIVGLIALLSGLTASSDRGRPVPRATVPEEADC